MIKRVVIKLGRKDAYFFPNLPFLNWRSYSLVFRDLVDKNSIETEGVIHLSKALLPSLQSLGLGLYYCKNRLFEDWLRGFALAL